MSINNKKTINGWAMYDWANSVYNLVITSTIFPVYFLWRTGDNIEATKKDSVAFLGRVFPNESLYTYIIGFAIFIVFLTMPILSSIADYRGTKKRFLSFFSSLGSIACMSLFFFTGKETLIFGVLGMTIACICYWSSLVFYNSYLPEIASPDQQDKVSAKGFSYGYIGSVLLQLLCFVLVFFPNIVGGSAEKGNTTTIQFQICFLMVGLWWFIFSRYALSRLPKGTALYKNQPKNIITSGFIELRKVVSELKTQPVLKRYIISFFFTSMGVQTIMLAASVYGKEELAIPETMLIVAILIIQLVAIGGAIGISKLSNKFGNIPTIIGCVIFWILLCVVGYLLPAGKVLPFLGLAFGVGLVMGGIQSLTRSTFAKLMPKTQDTTSYFSFYDATEKLALVIGMFSFGYITEITGSQRNAVLALTLFFVIALILLFVTKNEHDKN